MGPAGLALKFASVATLVRNPVIVNIRANFSVAVRVGSVNVAVVGDTIPVAIGRHLRVLDGLRRASCVQVALKLITVRDPDFLRLYRFGTKTTDFVLCGRCGVYVGAVLSYGGKKYATLNMRLSSLDTSQAEQVVYEGEPAEDRVARRMELFTPVIECPF